MPRLFLFLFVFVFALPAQACLHAVQNRLFVLGGKQDSLVVLRFDAVRGEQSGYAGSKEWIGVWKGTFSLLVYDKNYRARTAWKTARKTTGDSSNEIVALCKREVDSALHIVRKWNGFTEAVAESGILVPYTDSSSLVCIVRDTSAGKLYLQPRGSKKKLEERMLADTSNGIIYDLTANETTEPLTKQDYNLAYRRVSVVSVRKYTIGTKKLMVAMLGRGDMQFFESTGEKALPAKNTGNPVQHVYNENILHHGVVFDTFFWID